MLKRWLVALAAVAVVLGSSSAMADKKFVLITDPYAWFGNDTPNGELVFKVGAKSAIGLGGSFKSYTSTLGVKTSSMGLTADYFYFFSKPFSNSFFFDLNGSYLLTNSTLGISGYSASGLLGYWAGIGKDAIGLIFGVGGTYSSITLTGTGYSGLSTSGFGLALRLGFGIQF